jgi:hypothetical protein
MEETKIKLQVSPILDKLTALMENDLKSELRSIQALSMLPRDSNEVIIKVDEALRNMLSFEYLCRRLEDYFGQTVEVDRLSKLAYEIKTYVRVLVDDPFLSGYVLNNGYLDFKKELTALLLKIVGLANLFYSKTRSQKEASKEALRKEVANICAGLESICSQAGAILQGYSNGLIHEVTQKSEPLDQYLRCRRALLDCQNARLEEENKPLSAFSDGKKTKNAALALRKSRAVALLKEKEEAAKESFAVAEPVYMNSREALKSCLGDLDVRAHCLHHHVACKHMALCRIQKNIVHDIFFSLAVDSSGPAAHIVRLAIQELPSSMHATLFFLLQRYACESCRPDKQESVKGRLWEVCVALYAHRKGILSDMSADMALPGETFAREFDLILCDSQLLVDCKALNWKKHILEIDLSKPQPTDKMQQIIDQKDICDKRGVAYLLISKKDFPDYLKTWLKARDMYFIDNKERLLQVKKVGLAPVRVNFDDLYMPPYFFKH